MNPDQTYLILVTAYSRGQIKTYVKLKSALQLLDRNRNRMINHVA